MRTIFSDLHIQYYNVTENYDTIDCLCIRVKIVKRKTAAHN